MIRAILFDLFDTLVDLSLDALPEHEVGGHRIRSTSPHLYEALRPHAPVDFDTFARVLQEVDLELRAARYQEGLELPTRERFGAVLDRLGAPSPELAATLTEVHMTGIRSCVSFVPHHAEVLDRLRGRVRLGVCSNFSHAPTARKILEEAALLDRLDVVVISEEVGVRKPRPEIFRAALDRLEVQPEEAMHVGDQLVPDVEGAHAAGITPVWITRRVRDSETALQRHGGARPAHVVEDLGEVGDLLTPRRDRDG